MSSLEGWASWNDSLTSDTSLDIVEKISSFPDILHRILNEGRFVSRKKYSSIFPEKMFLGNDKSSNFEDLSQLFDNFFQSVYEPARPVGANCAGVEDTLFTTNIMVYIISSCQM
ncbi:hypothetical protein WA026_001628 [Henosepilachna vigintioctopunctata]|uniref:Uncharacterized protein n=1 Tax=Henosepilachna vigintioctopunctata TaxID=420089 RepID=A0AAW1UIK8_9CUCU